MKFIWFQSEPFENNSVYASRELLNATKKGQITGKKTNSNIFIQSLPLGGWSSSGNKIKIDKKIKLITIIMFGTARGIKNQIAKKRTRHGKGLQVCTEWVYWQVRWMGLQVCTAVLFLMPFRSFRSFRLNVLFYGHVNLKEKRRTSCLKLSCIKMSYSTMPLLKCYATARGTINQYKINRVL